MEADKVPARPLHAAHSHLHKILHPQVSEEMDVAVCENEWIKWMRVRGGYSRGEGIQKR